MSSRPAPVITLEHVSQRYPDGTIGLDDVSLQLYPGDLTCITGENGHGKSTLMRVLALDDMDIIAGRVLVMGSDLGQLTGRERDDIRGEVIEFIPQGHLGLVSRSPIHNIAHWLRYIDGYSRQEARKAALQALQVVGLPPDRYKVRVDRLSGGEGARVAIAMAYARNRPICLGDEIFAAVNPEAIGPLIGLLRGLTARGASVALIIHQHEVLPCFDRVLTVHDKRLSDDRRNAAPLQAPPIAAAAVAPPGLSGVPVTGPSRRPASSSPLPGVRPSSGNTSSPAARPLSLPGVLVARPATPAPPTSAAGPVSLSGSERVERVRQAIALNDDLGIVAAYDASLVHLFPPQEKRRVDLAVQRVDALKRFRHAVSTDDDRAIVQTYDRLLDGCPLVTAAERARLHLARQRVEAGQRLRQALTDDDDMSIVSVVNATRGTLTTSLPPQDQERVELARKRLDALQQFRRALRGDRDREIVDAYDAILDNYPAVAPAERVRLHQASKMVAMVERLRQAVVTNDDLAIMAVYDSSLAPALRALPPEERARIDLATRRVAALRRFREALKKNDDAEIARVYDRALDNWTCVTPEERRRLVLARQRVKAGGSAHPANRP
jgi:putative ABC transport system ATP-binding protein